MRVFRLFHEPYPIEVDDGYFYRFGSHTLTTSDLADLIEIMKPVASKTTVTGGSSILELDREGVARAPDFAFGRVTLSFWVADIVGPVVTIELGRDVDPEMRRSSNLMEEAGLSADEITRVDQATFRMVDHLNSTPQAFPPWKKRAVELSLVWAALVALALWFSITVWPEVPAILVGLLALIGIENLARQRLAFRFEETVRQRITVRAVTRQEVRDRRWNSRRDLKVVVGTFFVTAVATAVGTLAAVGWPF